MYIESGFAAGDYSVAAPDQGRRTAFARWFDLCAIEQLNAPGNYRLYIGRLDSTDIAAVGPDDLASARAQPNRAGRRIEYGAQPCYLFREPAGVIGKLGDAASLAGERPEAERRQPSRGPAVGFQQLAR